MYCCLLLQIYLCYLWLLLCSRVTYKYIYICMYVYEKSQLPSHIIYLFVLALHDKKWWNQFLQIIAIKQRAIDWIKRTILKQKNTAYYFKKYSTNLFYSRHQKNIFYNVLWYILSIPTFFSLFFIQNIISHIAQHQICHIAVQCLTWLSSAVFAGICPTLAGWVF